MQLNYCVQCGKPLIHKVIGDEGEQKYCADCDRFYFDDPACCVLVTIINEHGQVLLLKQNYISEKSYNLCSGYVQKGETLEETVAREVLEETGQTVLSCQYVRSYFYEPKNLIMAGFIAYVKASGFIKSNEVDDLMWEDIVKAADMVERVRNYCGVHLDLCRKRIDEKKLRAMNSSPKTGDAK